MTRATAFVLLAAFVAGPSHGAGEGMARARQAAQPGPASIKLAGATLHVPAGMSFVPRDAAVYFLAMNGLGPALETAGMVFPDADWNAWHGVLEYHPVGTVRDADAAWTAEADMARIRAESRTLVWALAFRSLATPPVDEMNYRISSLGRHGHFTWRISSRPAVMAKRLGDVRALWRAIEFDAGHRHEDFRRGDRVAPATVRSLLPDG